MQKSTNPHPQPPKSSDNPTSHHDGELLLHKVEEGLVEVGAAKDEARVYARQAVQITESFHSGPIPSVDSFAGYEEVCPGAARDILNMAIAEQKHGHSIENAKVYGEIFLKSIGMFVAVAIIALIVFGSIEAAKVDPKLSYIIGGGAGIALVLGKFYQIFFSQKPQQKQAPENKQISQTKRRRK